jgi:hypothetical protein
MEESHAWRKSVYSQQMTKVDFEKVRKVVNVFNGLCNDYAKFKNLKKETNTLQQKCVKSVSNLMKKQITVANCLKLDIETKKDIMILGDNLNTYKRNLVELEKQLKNLSQKRDNTIGPFDVFVRYTELGHILIPDRTKIIDVAVGFKLSCPGGQIDIYSYEEYEGLIANISKLHAKLQTIKNKEIKGTELIINMSNVIQEDEAIKQKLIDDNKIKKPQIVIVEHQAIDDDFDEAIDGYDDTNDKYYD